MASIASANRMVDAELGTTAHVAPTTPIKLQLTTAAGSSSAAGTQVTGGSYAAQTITFGSAASGVAASSNAPSFTGMPAVTITGVNLVDSSGSPRFLGYGALTGGSKTTNAGDIVSFAVGQVTYAVTPA